MGKPQQSKRLRDNVAAKAKYRKPAVQYPASRGRDPEAERVALDKAYRETEPKFQAT